MHASTSSAAITAITIAPVESVLECWERLCKTKYPNTVDLAGVAVVPVAMVPVAVPTPIFPVVPTPTFLVRDMPPDMPLAGTCVVVVCTLAEAGTAVRGLALVWALTVGTEKAGVDLVGVDISTRMLIGREGVQ